jgi:predicted nucleic acid-binding protein
MDILILDASVGAKWFFKEEMWEKATLLMEHVTEEEVRIVVPEIFYSELANTWWRRVKRKIVSVDDAIQALGTVMNLSLERYPDWEIVDIALENSLRFKISIYDSLYLALAEIYLAPLVTADEILYKTCRSRFDFIEFLPDFTL